MLPIRLSEHDVVEAASGAEGQHILERDQAFDLILCDMMMSKVSGVELHQWLDARYPDLARQMVFITGGAFTPRARAYLAQVNNLQLEKPLDTAALRKLVGEQIDASRAAQRRRY